MPRIPITQVRGQTGGSPNIAAPQGPQPMQDVVGRQLQQQGAAVTGVGDAVARIASNLQDQYDDGRTKEGLLQFDSVALKKVTEFRQKRGRDASKYEVARTIANLEEERNAVARDLDNPVQSQLFMENSARRILGIREQFYAHSAEETIAFNAGQSKALSDQSIREAITSGVAKPVDRELAMGAELEDMSSGATTWQGELDRAAALRQQPLAVATKDRPDAFTIAKNNAVGQRKEWAAAQGWKPDDPRTKDAVLGVTNEIHAGIVLGHVRNGSTDRAVDYLKNLEKDGATGELDPRTLSELRKTVDSATSADRALKVGEDVIWGLDQAAHQGKVDIDAHDRELGQKAFGKVMSQFRAGKIDAQQAKMAMQHVQEVQASRAQAWHSNAVSTLQSAEKLLSDPANATLSPNSPTFPPELRRDLVRYGQLDAAVAFAETKRYATDWNVYADVLDGVRAGKFAGMPLKEFTSRYRGQLADREWNVALAGYESVNAKGGRTKGSSIWTVDLAIDEFARSQEILSRGTAANDETSKRGEPYARLRKRIADHVSAFEETVLQGKREATVDEVQTHILDKMALDQAFVQDWTDMGSSTKKLFEMDTEERASAFVYVGGEKVRLADVPTSTNPLVEGVSEYLTKMLISRGIFPSQQEVATLWVLAGRPRDVGETVENRVDADLEKRVPRKSVKEITEEFNK